MYYECIIQDTFNKLEVGKIYYIEDNWLYSKRNKINVHEWL